MTYIFIINKQKVVSLFSLLHPQTPSSLLFFTISSARTPTSVEKTESERSQKALQLCLMFRTSLYIIYNDEVKGGFPPTSGN